MFQISLKLILLFHLSSTKYLLVDVEDGEVEKRVKEVKVPEASGG